MILYIYIIELFIKYIITIVSMIQFPGSIDTTCVAIGTAASGGLIKPCVFPFKYDGVMHYQCTAVSHPSNKPWCAVGVKNGHAVNGWGNCDMGTCKSGSNS